MYRHLFLFCFVLFCFVFFNIVEFTSKLNKIPSISRKPYDQPYSEPVTQVVFLIKSKPREVYTTTHDSYLHLLSFVCKSCDLMAIEGIPKDWCPRLFFFFPILKSIIICVTPPPSMPKIRLITGIWTSSSSTFFGCYQSN